MVAGSVIQVIDENSIFCGQFFIVSESRSWGCKAYQFRESGTLVPIRLAPEDFVFIGQAEMVRDDAS
jgi:hypothetical protein